MNVLLLHPLPFGGSVYSEVVEALGEPCCAPTLYGAGDDLGRWAEAALDAVGTGPVVVAGTSIGGSCAIEVARLAPDKVKALVLCGTKPGHRPEPLARDAAVEHLEQEGLAAAWDRYWAPLFGPDASADTLERAWGLVSEHGLDAIVAGVRAFHGRRDREGFLRAWPGPVQIVSGTYDLDPERDRRLASRLPDGTHRLVDAAGHYVPFEAPGAFAAILAEALADAS